MQYCISHAFAQRTNNEDSFFAHLIIVESSIVGSHTVLFGSAPVIIIGASHYFDSRLGSGGSWLQRDRVANLDVEVTFVDFLYLEDEVSTICHVSFVEFLSGTITEFTIVGTVQPPGLVRVHFWCQCYTISCIMLVERERE